MRQTDETVVGPPYLFGNNVKFVIDLLQCGLEAIGLEQYRCILQSVHLSGRV